MSQAEVIPAGKKFGKLTVVGEAESIRYDEKGTIRRRILCKCRCGNEVSVRLDALRSGHTVSCGCYRPKPKRSNKPKVARLDIKEGQIFGYLTILKEVESVISCNRYKRRFLCKCKCGVEKIILLHSLTLGSTVSCGCYNREESRKRKACLTHGLSDHRIYKVWKGIRCRCYNKNNKSYFRYGGRGIKMCADWYKDFKTFYNWAISNGYQDGLECDRRNNDRGYSPGNCRWVTSEVNNNNKRNNIKYKHKGQVLTLPQIARMEGIGFPTLYRRINENNLTVAEALAIPLNGRCKKDRIISNKFTIDQIKEVFLSSLPIKEIVKAFNMSGATIWRIKSKQAYLDILKDM